MALKDLNPSVYFGAVHLPSGWNLSPRKKNIPKDRRWNLEMFTLQ